MGATNMKPLLGDNRGECTTNLCMTCKGSREYSSGIEVELLNYTSAFGTCIQKCVIERYVCLICSYCLNMSLCNNHENNETSIGRKFSRGGLFKLH